MSTLKTLCVWPYMNNYIVGDYSLKMRSAKLRRGGGIKYLYNKKVPYFIIKATREC